MAEKKDDAKKDGAKKKMMAPPSFDKALALINDGNTITQVFAKWRAAAEAAGLQGTEYKNAADAVRDVLAEAWKKRERKKK